MGGYLAYTEYKDSGVEWLGEIPSHWKALRLKFNSYMKGRIGWQNLRSDEFIDEGPYLITGMHFKDGGIDWKACYHISEERYQMAPEIWVQPKDLLITKDGTIGKVAYIEDLPGKASLNSHLLVLRPVGDEGYYPRFIYYVLGSEIFQFYAALTATGTTFNGISQESIANFSVPFSPVEEQRSIARFLDYKTAQIDALIAKKETLLKKLAEKRTALISQAVTKGCDRTVPMKDSGIEWLGEIPTHWEPIRLKFLIRHIEGGFSPQCYGYPPSEGEWGVLKTGCVNGGIFNSQASKTLPETIEPPPELEVQKGDVLMSRASGSIDLVGSVAIVSEQPMARLLLSDKTFRLNLNLSVCDANFFVLAMGSSMVRQQIHQVISGAEGLANNIAQSSIRELIVSLPPFSEQQKISQFLGNKISEAENQMQKVSQAIQTLKEYRVVMHSNDQSCNEAL